MDPDVAMIDGGSGCWSFYEITMDGVKPGEKPWDEVGKDLIREHRHALRRGLV